MKKRYEEGGEVEFETKTGRNKTIGDDVRARAMAAMEKDISEEPTPTPKKAAPKATPKSAPKAEPKPYKEKSGFEQKKAKVLGYKMGGSVSSASKRADGCATKGKTRGRMV